MRLTAILAIVAILMPAALAKAAPQADRLTDVSAAKKKKPPAKKKEQYLKAAPGTGPSGPTK